MFEEDINGLTLKFEGDLLFKYKSPFQLIEVYSTVPFGNMLVLDGKIQTVERFEYFYHEMIVHPPMSFIEEPKHVLVIGGGDGGTVNQLIKYDTIERIDVVEIDEMVIEISKKYFSTALSFEDPRVHLHIMDGGKFIAAKKGIYDLIVVDNSDPIGPSDVLYTTSFYYSVKRALSPNGVVVAQSESPIFQMQNLKAVRESMSKNFSNVLTYVSPVPFYPGGIWSFTMAFDGEREWINHDVKTKFFSGKMLLTPPFLD